MRTRLGPRRGLGALQGATARRILMDSARTDHGFKLPQLIGVRRTRGPAAAAAPRHPTITSTPCVKQLTGRNPSGFKVSDASRVSLLRAPPRWSLGNSFIYIYEGGETHIYGGEKGVDIGWLYIYSSRGRKRASHLVIKPYHYGMPEYRKGCSLRLLHRSYFSSNSNPYFFNLVPIVVTLPSATTARDLSPSRPARKSAHRNVASNNLRRLQRINSQDERVSLRVEGDRAPERLQLAADEAARSGDLQTTIEYANGARHTIRLWNEFRVWDPGD